MTAKPISIKGIGCKFGGCVRKAVELTSGDPPFVRKSGLRIERLVLTGRQKRQRRSNHVSDEGPNGPRKGSMGVASKQRNS